MSGNEDISQSGKGDKFMLDRHDGTARNADGKGRFWSHFLGLFLHHIWDRNFCYAVG